MTPAELYSPLAEVAGSGWAVESAPELEAV